MSQYVVVGVLYVSLNDFFQLIGVSSKGLPTNSRRLSTYAKEGRVPRLIYGVGLRVIGYFSSQSV